MKSSDTYIKEVKSIAPQGMLWGAIKSQPVEHVVYLNKNGYALHDGRVIALEGCSYNDILGLAKLNQETLELLDAPLFKTIDEPDDLRIGLFDEVFKRGYTVFPLEPLKDFNNNPIVVQK